MDCHASVSRAAVVVGAMRSTLPRAVTHRSSAAARNCGGHPGQIATARAYRETAAGQCIRASHLVNDDRVQDPLQPCAAAQVMGACRDLITAGRPTLLTRRTPVTTNPLVFARKDPRGPDDCFPAAISTPSRWPSRLTLWPLAIAEIGALRSAALRLLIDATLSASAVLGA